MLRVGNIAFDCGDVLSVARFWSAALERPLDPHSGPEFASIGGGDADRGEPAWYFEKVPEGNQTVSRTRELSGHVLVPTADPTARDGSRAGLPAAIASIG